MTVKKNPSAARKKRSRAKAGQAAGAVEARRKAFIEAYIANGGNATEAAKAAGYSEKTARQQGARLLSNVAIREELEKRQAALATKHELTADVVIHDMARVIHFDPRRLFDDDGQLKHVKDLDEDVAAVLTGIETVQLGSPEAPVVIKKLKWESKATAREQAMKHLGLFEKDNKQRAGLLGELPREMVEAIRDRLNELARQRK